MSHVWLCAGNVISDSANGGDRAARAHSAPCRASRLAAYTGAAVALGAAGRRLRLPAGVTAAIQERFGASEVGFKAPVKRSRK